ncbi:Palmitoyltransferase [Hypoxylon texense]
MGSKSNSGDSYKSQIEKASNELEYEGDTVETRIYADVDKEPELEPFHRLDHADLKTYPLQAKDGKYKITIQFVGEDYLKMQVPRHLIKEYKTCPVADSAPEIFEFIGVVRRFKKRKAEEIYETRQMKMGRFYGFE